MAAQGGTRAPGGRAYAQDDRQRHVVELFGVVKVIWFAGESTAIAQRGVMNRSGCHDLAISVAAGTRTRPIARLKPMKDVTPGKIPKLMIAAKTTRRRGADNEQHRAGMDHAPPSARTEPQ